jgi:hypothetical protein
MDQKNVKTEMGCSLHDLLWKLCQKLPTDFEPYGQRSRDDDWGPDCSCGCKFFLPVDGDAGADWGVCCNQESPRRGLLTFEHMGCKHYVDDIKAYEEMRISLESQPGYAEQRKAFLVRADAYRKAHPDKFDKLDPETENNA